MKFKERIMMLVWGFFLLMSSTLLSFSDSFKQPPQLYDQYIVGFTVSDQLQVYTKDHEFLWSVDATNFQQESLFIYFNRLFLLTDTNGLVSLDLKTHLTVFDQEDIGLKEVAFYHPFIYGRTTENELVSLEIDSGNEVWSHPVVKGHLVVFPGTSYVGVLGKSLLTLYNRVTGLKQHELSLKKGDWSFVTSWNRGAIFFDKIQGYYKLDFESLTIDSVTLDESHVLGWFQQKEAIVHIPDSQIISSYDVESDSSEWLLLLDQQPVSVALYGDDLVLKNPSQNIQVVDLVEGTIVFSSFIESDQLVNGIYQFNNHWYGYSLNERFKLESDD